MPGNPETQAPGFGTVQFALQVQNAKVEVRAELPQGPVGPDVLLPVLQGLSNSMTDLAVLSASRLGEQVSCHEGCGACCRQAVPIAQGSSRHREVAR